MRRVEEKAAKDEMTKTQKRKNAHELIKPKRSRSKEEEEKEEEEPYPNHPRPTREECVVIRDSLLSFHGFPPEFAKYRQQRLAKLSQNEPRTLDHKEEESETVLDGLIKTLLSQNTTEVNSQRAFANLKAAFPTWDEVLFAESNTIEDAIRCGGLAPTKASCIKNILSRLHKEKGKLCLEYLRNLSVDEVKAELSHFKGIGPKTVACVLMFNLQHDDLPVDTHVFEIAKAIGWVPDMADRNKTYTHLNRRIPNELKFDLNCLLYTHGKLCRKCTKKGANQLQEESCDNPCPLLNYSIVFSSSTTEKTNC